MARVLSQEAKDPGMRWRMLVGIIGAVLLGSPMSGDFWLARSYGMGQGMSPESKMMLKESVTDLGIVAGSTVVGAVIGLSTLSFVDKPSKHMNHVVIGGAIGIIVGVGIVAWRQASSSQGAPSTTLQALGLQQFDSVLTHKLLRGTKVASVGPKSVLRLAMSVSSGAQRMGEDLFGPKVQGFMPLQLRWTF